MISKSCWIESIKDKMKELLNRLRGNFIVLSFMLQSPTDCCVVETKWFWGVKLIASVLGFTLKKEKKSHRLFFFASLLLSSSKGGNYIKRGWDLAHLSNPYQAYRSYCRQSIYYFFNLKSYWEKNDTLIKTQLKYGYLVN